MDITRTWYAGKRFVIEGVIYKVVHIGYRGITYAGNGKSWEIDRYQMDILGRKGGVRNLAYGDLTSAECREAFRWVCGSFGLNADKRKVMVRSEVFYDIIRAGAEREWGTVNVKLREIGVR